MSNPDPSSVRRDIIVMGASAGGVDALRSIVEALPRDLPASVFVVLHISRDTPSVLARLLGQVGSMEVRTAEDDDPIRPGVLYVAPRDRHMVLEPERVRVVLGPVQNRNRPSIDVLFRSAAIAFGPRVIGVVLTGFLNDGTAGLQAIKDQGGLTIVQDPKTALFPGMPESALRSVPIDRSVPLTEIPQVLMASTNATRPNAKVEPSEVLEFETRADRGAVEGIEQVASPSSFLCPDCGGALWELRGGRPARFRCRVGHGYSIEDLAASQEVSIERALWAASRALADRAALSRRLADSWREREAQAIVEHFTREAERSAEYAAKIQSILGADLREEEAP